MATLEQRRAAYALRHVESAHDGDDLNDAKLRTQLVKLPARLHNNGLGPTAAYLRAQKPDSAERHLFTWLECWLTRADGGIYAESTCLLDAITGKGGAVKDGQEEILYRRASVEARALAVWLKRFAEAFLRESEEAA